MAKKENPAKAKTADAEATPLSNVPRPRLHKLRVSNFRCIGPTPVEIELDDIVVLVGPNNVGKSCILRAYEVVMLHGSKEGELTIEDFPNGKVDPAQPPTIEIETVVYDAKAPGERWVRTDPTTKEMFVREKWTWAAPGAPTKVGWNVAANDWHASEGPWGAPNVAGIARPEPHHVGAFDSPEEQAKAVAKLLREALTERVKGLGKQKGETEAPTDYEQLLDSVRELQKAIAAEAEGAVADVKAAISGIVAEVFPGYAVSFDARAEDDIEKSVSLFKADPQLRMGPEGGHQASIDKQGSGARRTLVWTALRILAEHKRDKKATAAQRPHLLLIDEPELCLHPDAIREACRVLYDLPNKGNWQVMVTTHSPVFVDLSRDNTSIVRVERRHDGVIFGTTVFRPKKCHLDDDDRARLKMLNLCDPYVAEFFFGGRTIIVEGDTEYTAFTHAIAQDQKAFKDIHVVRARGKAPIVSLCKILNHFGSGYAVLHDSDRPQVPTRKTKKMITNPAWSVNLTILNVIQQAPDTTKVRLVASLPNFEEALFGEEAEDEKPYSALEKMQKDGTAFGKIKSLLEALMDPTKALPFGTIAWSKIDELEAALAAQQDGPTTKAN
jgi:putative ATP-dependent endonuclease of OLD family